MEVLDPHLVLEVPEGFPGGGGIYRGLRAYFEEFLYRFYGGYDLDTSVDEFIESGDRVVALGWHRGRALSTGNRVQVRFAHVWTVHDGRLAAGLMYTDTAMLCGASAPSGAPAAT
jgi:ketosteroid isomerase-like protein